LQPEDTQKLTTPVNLFRTKAKALSLLPIMVKKPAISIPKMIKATATIHATRSAILNPCQAARHRERQESRPLGGISAA
jgi:hypothetical protein